MTVFELTLHDTYYNQGFFNVPVAFDRYVRPSDGLVTLTLGSAEQTVEARVNRRANPNGTARIMGGIKLRDWFQSHFSQGDSVSVVFHSPELIHIGDS